MSVSIYVREDKVIEMYLYYWTCKVLCENPSLGSFWEWSWAAFSSIDKPDLYDSWAVGCVPLPWSWSKSVLQIW